MLLESQKYSLVLILLSLFDKLTTASKFEDFYAFAFQYCLTGELSLDRSFDKNLFLLIFVEISVSTVWNWLIFRGKAKECRHWDCVWITESRTGSSIPAPGWFIDQVFEGMLPCWLFLSHFLWSNSSNWTCICFLK